MRFNKKILGTIFLFIPFFKPAGLEYFQVLNILFIVWKYLAIAILVFFMLCRNSKITVNRGLIALTLYWGVLNLNNLMNHNFDVSYLVNGIVSILLMEYFIYAAKCGKFENTLKIFAYIFRINVWLQFISIFVVRFITPVFGMTDEIGGDYFYFMGTDNFSAFFMIPMMGIVVINSFIAKKDNNYRKEALVYLGIYTLLYFYLGSYSAAFAGLIIFILIALSHQFKRIVEKINVKFVAFAVGIVVIVLTYFGVQGSLNYFIINVLGKSSTMSGRTVIWEQALGLISEKPILGWGELSKEQIANYALYGTSHAHNFLLDLLLLTGVVGMIAYMYFVFAPVKLSNCNNEMKLIVQCFLVGQFVLWTMDFYSTNPAFYCFMAVIYCLKQHPYIHESKMNVVTYHFKNDLI